MPPAPVRTPNKRNVAALPETSRLSFLLAASQLFAQSVPEASSHLGSQALKVGLHLHCTSCYRLQHSGPTLLKPGRLVLHSGLISSSFRYQEGHQRCFVANVEPTAFQKRHSWSKCLSLSANAEGKLRNKPKAGRERLAAHFTLCQLPAWIFVSCRLAEHKIAAICPCQVRARHVCNILSVH